MMATLGKELTDDEFTVIMDKIDEVRCVRNSSAVLNHARLRFNYIFDARMDDYIRTHPYNMDTCSMRSRAYGEYWLCFDTVHLQCQIVVGCIQDGSGDVSFDEFLAFNSVSDRVFDI